MSANSNIEGTEKRLKVKNNNTSDELVVGAIRITTYIFFVILLAIITKIVFEGISFISFDFLFQPPENYMLDGGIGPAIFGTFSVAFIMLLIALPIGVFSGIYISEYSGDDFFSKVIRISVNNLAGVPSIVFGLFGLGFFVLTLGKRMDEVFATGRFFGQPIMLWASVILALLILPTIITTTVQTLKAIPDSQRLAAYSMGATKWQTIKNVLIPQSKPGILTGIILSLSRGVGETAPVLFLGCAFFLPNLPLTYINLGLFSIPLINPGEQFMYLSYHIFVLATQSTNATQTLPVQYATTLVLLVITVILNSVAFVFRYRFKKIVRLNRGFSE